MTGKKMISTHEFKCRGFEEIKFGNEKRRPILPEGDSVSVLLKTYEDGSTFPLCGFFNEKTGKCGVDNNYSNCPYLSKN